MSPPTWAEVNPDRTAVKVYRRHRCTAKHRTYNKFAKCIWPRAEWVHGEGPFACVAYCGVITVTLWPTLELAERAKRQIDGDACGGLCGNAHEIVRLQLPAS